MKNTKDFLINNCKLGELDGKLYVFGKRKLRELKFYESKKRHIYGKDVVYLTVSLYNYETKKAESYTAQQIYYIWAHGSIPKGYDIDHIDGDTFNNDISNLKAITRKENLAKRKVQSNQYIAAKENNKEVDLSKRKKKYQHSEKFLKKQKEKSAIIK